MPHFFENRQEYRSVYILLTRSDTYFFPSDSLTDRRGLYPCFYLSGR